MRWKSLMTSCLAIVLSLTIGSAQSVAQEKKVIVLDGARQLVANNLAPLGAVTYMNHAGSTDYQFSVHGQSTFASYARVSGLNHDLFGAQVGADDQPAVATDVLMYEVDVQDVTLSGTTDIEGQLSHLDVEHMVDYLSDSPDVHIVANTTYSGGTIGAPDNMKVVLVENAELDLLGDFAGYGVLILRDSDPNLGLPKLRMQDGATWTGLIIGVSGDTPSTGEDVWVELGRQNTVNDIVVVDGQIIVDEETWIEAHVLGSQITYGAGGPEMDVKLWLKEGASGLWYKPFGNVDLDGGEIYVKQDVAAGKHVQLWGKTYYPWGSVAGSYGSTDGSGHVLTLVDGDAPLQFDPFDGQAPLEQFIEPYVNAETGVINLEPNQALVMWEFNPTLDSVASDFQDLVVLFTTTPSSAAGGGSEGGGEIGGSGVEPGEGVRVLGAIVLEGRDLDIKIDGVADVFYSEEALSDVDVMIQSIKGYEWSRWQEQ